MFVILLKPTYQIDGSFEYQWTALVYVPLYARPSLSFLDVVFHAADGYGPGVVFIPSRRARGELAAWLAFVLFMSVDLRAEVDSRVFRSPL